MTTEIPLCVDMDGTLLQTDTLLESLLVLLKAAPLSILRIPRWLIRGRANLKHEFANRVTLAVASLPLNAEFVEFLRVERASGRRLMLVTGSNHRMGDAVAKEIGIFDEVCASDATVNLTGSRKARFLVDRFGNAGFDYAGNGRVDLAIWAEARRAIIVSNSAELVRKAEALSEVERVFRPSSPRSRVWLRALRVHQWAKNLLIFIPLMGAHQWHNPSKLGAAVLAFFAFSICASGVYVLNDLFDLEADRHHATKRMRPFASGELPLLAGMIAAPLLLLTSILLACLLPPPFWGTLACYYLMTVLYSLRLKQVEILDVLTLAALYSIRVVAGGYGAEVAVSDWLLVFSIFVFLSLAFVKRFTELQLVQRGKSDRVKGRGYRVGDLELVSTMGLASGYLAVLVFAFYVTNPEVTHLYRNPAALWFACPVLLYWISRVWLLAHRGVLHEDPIVFALTDRASWIVCAILLIIGIIALPK